VLQVPLTDLAVDAFRDQLQLAGTGPYRFPSDEDDTRHQTTVQDGFRLTLASEGAVLSRRFEFGVERSESAASLERTE